MIPGAPATCATCATCAAATSPVPPVAVGIDVSSRALHIVGLDADAHIVRCERVSALDRTWMASLPTSLPSGLPIGIDGPDGPSAAPYAADESLAPKFRSARGAEVELGRQHRLWVSFATPTAEEAMPEWMRVASKLFRELRARRHDPLETWPYATFRVLTRGRAGRLPPKTTPEGRRARIDALVDAGVHPRASLDRASHDVLDATAAAVVALQKGRGSAQPVRCERDGTAIWLCATPADPTVSDPVPGMHEAGRARLAP